MKPILAVSALLMLWTTNTRCARPTTRPTTRLAVPITPAHLSNPKTTVCDLGCCLCDASRTRVTCECNAQCQDFTLSNLGPNLLPTEVNTLTITKCRRAKITRSCFANAPNLRQVKIERVKELEIGSLGFYYPYAKNQARPAEQPFAGGSLIRENITTTQDDDHPELQILIFDSIFEMLSAHSFAGSISHIYIKNCNMKTIPPSTFNHLEKLKTLVINETVIDKIDTGAFNNITTKSLAIARSTINRIEKDAIRAVVHDQTTIRHNSIGMMSPESIVTMQSHFMFFNNTIGTLSTHALETTTLYNVTVEANRFENVRRHAFHHVKPADPTKFQMEFNFARNAIAQYEPGALTFNEQISTLLMQISTLVLPEDCSSDFNRIVHRLLELQQTASNTPKHGKRSVDADTPDYGGSPNEDEVFFSTEAAFTNKAATRATVSTTTATELKRNIETMIYDAIYCQDHGKSRSLYRYSIGDNSDLDDDSREHSSVLVSVIIPVIIIVLLCGLVGLVAFCFIRQYRRKHSKTAERKSSVTVSSSGGEKNSERKWVIAVPDTRVYQESELQVTLEYVQPMEEATVLQMKQDCL